VTENSFQIAQLYGLTAFPALMIAAALCDLTTYRIPNKLSAALALAFVPAVFLAPLSGSEIGFHVAVGVAALGLGIAAFAMGWIGGGDGKFLAAAALWLGPSDILRFSLVFSVLGGVLTLLFLTARHLPLPAPLARTPWILRLWDMKAGIPYALALAAGGLVVYPDSQIWQHLIVR
jgi:prepilin peptidase CpaA